jgi:hypothetical protein
MQQLLRVIMELKNGQNNLESVLYLQILFL